MTVQVHETRVSGFFDVSTKTTVHTQHGRTHKSLFDSISPERLGVGVSCEGDVKCDLILKIL